MVNELRNNFSGMGVTQGRARVKLVRTVLKISNALTSNVLSLRVSYANIKIKPNQTFYIRVVYIYLGILFSAVSLVPITYANSYL